MRDHFGYQSFQAPELSSQEAVVACLKSIVHRRNEIAHEADRDPEDGTIRRSISAGDASRTIDQVEQIATAIAAVLGTPPAAMRGQPVDDTPARVRPAIRLVSAASRSSMTCRRNKGCRIETRLTGVTIEDRERWPDIRRWMEDSQARLRAAVDAVGGVPEVVSPPGSVDV